MDKEFLGAELHLGERAVVSRQGNRRDAVGNLEERIRESSHVKDLESPGKDGERFGVFRLGRVRFDDAKSDSPAGAFVGKK